MAGRFDFKSPGGQFNRTLQDALLKAEIQRRNFYFENLEADSRIRATARAEAEARRAAALATHQDADRTAGIYGPSADLNPEAAATLRAGGYQVEDRSTLPAATIAMPATTAPVDPRQAAVQRGQDIRAAMGYGPTVAAQDLPSQSYSRRAETYAEQLAREQREAAQAEKDEARTFRNDQAVAQRTFQGEQNDANRQARAEQSAADRELKTLIASMSQSQSAETRALGSQLKQLQIEAEKDKIEASRKDRDQATKAKAQGRSNVKNLAQGLIDDPNLDRITGNVGATTPDMLPGSIDARARLVQLVNSLSLNEREKLKGSGAISDFEAKMLGAAASAIDPRAGAEMVRKHLKAIVAVMSDGEPGGNGPRPGERRMINGQLGEWDGRGWLPVGGGR